MIAEFENDSANGRFSKRRGGEYAGCRRRGWRCVVKLEKLEHSLANRVDGSKVVLVAQPQLNTEEAGAGRDDCPADLVIKISKVLSNLSGLMSAHIGYYSGLTYQRQA